MLSLKERLELLENDLKARPPKISVYHDLPFAILRYDPWEEWQLRDQIRLLARRLDSSGKEVVMISLAELLWDAIKRSEGIDALIELEQDLGFEKAQDQASIYLSDSDWKPLPDLLSERMASLDPEKNIVFLVRAASMAPAIYRMSKLLDEMHGRTTVTTILFYPGTLEGTTTGLRFMDLKDQEVHGNYRVKVYG
jgi:hypothetical protein